MVAAPSDATVICFDNSLTIISDKTFFVAVLFTNSDSEIWILAPMDFMVDSRNDDVAIVVFHALFAVFYEANSLLFMVEAIPRDIIDAGEDLVALLINQTMSGTVLIADNHFIWIMPGIDRGIYGFETLFARWVNDLFNRPAEFFIEDLDFHIAVVAEGDIKELGLKQDFLLCQIIDAHGETIARCIRIFSVKQDSVLPGFIREAFKGWFCEPVTLAINDTPVTVFPATIMDHEHIGAIEEVLDFIEDEGDNLVTVLVDGTPELLFRPVTALIILVVPFRVDSPFALCNDSNTIFKVSSIDILGRNNLLTRFIYKTPSTSCLSLPCYINCFKS